MNALPDFITEWLQPAAKPLLKFKRVCLGQTGYMKIDLTFPGPMGDNRPHLERRRYQDERRPENYLPGNIE